MLEELASVTVSYVFSSGVPKTAGGGDEGKDGD